MQLDPGDAHPHAPCPPADLAGRLGVAVDDLLRWATEGCPCRSDGLVDPYDVTNWLSWGRLDRCPALARRWRAWLRWFTTIGRPCRLLVRRIQHCHLPASAALRWWVPEPPDAPGQRVLGRVWQEGEPAGAWRLLRRGPAILHAYEACDEIALAAVPAEPRDRPALESLVAELAASFTYAYRRHRAGEAPQDRGTCLDLARWCGSALTRAGRRWRLVCGVVAHRALANPHFWVEVDDGSAGWVPLDPTIPAVARMLGGDWRATVPLAVGRHDGRRIRVGVAGDGIPGVPWSDDLAGCAGEVDAGGRGALYCTDWAVGACAWSVAAA